MRNLTEDELNEYFKWAQDNDSYFVRWQAAPVAVAMKKYGVVRAVLDRGMHLHSTPESLIITLLTLGFQMGRDIESKLLATAAKAEIS